MTYHCIKTDPTFQEDQDDLLMSYLNSDYMAPSSSSTASDSPSTPEFNSAHQGSSYTASMTTTVDLDDNSWNSSAPSTPTTNNDNLFHQQQQAIVSCFRPDVLNTSLQFVVTNHEQIQQQSIANMVYFPSFHLLQPQPASPVSLSSYSSSASDNEQSKKKRGRKKRNSNYSAASSNSGESSTPPSPSTATVNTTTATISSNAANTHASNMSAPVKHLPAILPALHNNNSVPRNPDNQKFIYTKKESLIDTQSSQILNCPSTNITVATADVRVVNPDADLQKAATIAKRQERLIKNRAAALLSRKRKREHLSALEEQCTDLTSVNQVLLEKVSQLEKENTELKNRLLADEKQQNAVISSGDIISMVISLVLFIKREREID